VFAAIFPALRHRRSIQTNDLQAPLCNIYIVVRDTGKSNRFIRSCRSWLSLGNSNEYSGSSDAVVTEGVESAAASGGSAER